MLKVFFIFVYAITSFALNLPKIKDIASIPQNFGQFGVDLNSSFAIYQEEFVKRYYEPWDDDINISRIDFDFGEKYFQNKTHYGDNKQEISQSFKDKLVANANKESFPSMEKNGITIRNTDCRLLPTSKPFFLDFSKESGGYPFDYMQNSIIHINTPIKVLHYSKDFAFVYVKSPYVEGWISSSDIAFVSKKDIKRVKNMKLNTPINDDISISDANNFISKVYIGAVFWEDKNSNLYIFKGDYNSKGVLTKIKSYGENGENKSANFQQIPQMPSKETLQKIASSLYGQNYGWGGFLQNRDCSMMIRDFYTTFGLFMPRNSYDQANDKSEEILSLAGKTREEKIAIIKEKGIPFATLLYMKGHIMMYIGTFDDEIVIFHSFWSIKTLNKGRFIVGGSFVTSLTPGIELAEFDHENGTLLDKLISMRILGTKNNL